MKQIALLIFIGSMFFACGEAGVGFNVQKEFPVEVPIDIVIPGNPLGGFVNVDPDPTAFNYDLNSVGAFSDALSGLDDLGSIVVNGMSYEIVDVQNANVDIEDLSISVDIAGSKLVILDIQGTTLANLPKTDITLTDLQKNNLVNELFNAKIINSEVIFDLGSVPATTEDQNINFNFRVYFDITLKARNLN